MSSCDKYPLHKNLFDYLPILSEEDVNLSEELFNEQLNEQHDDIE
jgi:hypothetical protein